MSRSLLMRAADIRTVFQLFGGCRKLGDDPTVWRLHLFAGIACLEWLRRRFDASASGPAEQAQDVPE